MMGRSTILMAWQIGGVSGWKVVRRKRDHEVSRKSASFKISYQRELLTAIWALAEALMLPNLYRRTRQTRYIGNVEEMQMSCFGLSASHEGKFSNLPLDPWASLGTGLPGLCVHGAA